MSAARILLVDDEPLAARALQRALRAAAITEVDICEHPADVEPTLDEGDHRLVLIDLAMPGRSGEDVMASLLQRPSPPAIIVVTGTDDAETAVRCLKAGAADYLVKPVKADLLVATIERTLRANALEAENIRLRQALLGQAATIEGFDEVITQSTEMRRAMAYLAAVAPGEEPVLITGESGTGKELLARGLHRASGRRGPFVAVNVAGLDEQMFTDSLFGHDKGAFTGAITARGGVLLEAAGGTVLLDEIGDLAESTQVKLLRVIQERSFRPLGSDREVPLTARVVAATHQPLASLRTDLLFRLRAYHVHLSPLRERPADIAPLFRRFLEQAATDLGRETAEPTDEALTLLLEMPLPGNARELRAMAFHAAALATDGVVTPALLSPIKAPDRAPPATATGGTLTRPADVILQPADFEALERDNMIAALEQTAWRVSGAGGAAELLGLPPTTVASQMKRLGIERPGKRPRRPRSR